MARKTKTKITLILRREILPGDISGDWLLSQQKFVGVGWRPLADAIEGQLKDLFGEKFFHRHGKGLWVVSGDDTDVADLAHLVFRLQQALGTKLDLTVPSGINRMVEERIWEKRLAPIPSTPLEERIAALEQTIVQNKKDLAVLKRARELLQ